MPPLTNGGHYIAPDIVEAILDGSEPEKLTMATLRRGIPDDWNEQRRVFGLQ